MVISYGLSVIGCWILPTVFSSRHCLFKVPLSAQQPPVTSAATCGTPPGVFLCVSLKVAFDVPGERIVRSKSLYQPSSRRDVGCHLWDPSRCFSLRFPQGGVRRPRRTHWPFQCPSISPAAAGTSAATCGTPPGVFLCVFLKVAFDVPGERIGRSKSLYQPSSRRDVGCHLWDPARCFPLCFPQGGVRRPRRTH